MQAYDVFLKISTLDSLYLVVELSCMLKQIEVS